MFFRAYSILYRSRILAAVFIALLLPVVFVLIAANLCDCGGDAVMNKLKALSASSALFLYSSESSSA